MKFVSNNKWCGKEPKGANDSQTILHATRNWLLLQNYLQLKQRLEQSKFEFCDKQSSA